MTKDKEENPLKELTPPRIPLIFDILLSIGWAYWLIKFFIIDPDTLIIEWINPEYLWILDYRILIFVTFWAIVWKVLGHKRFSTLLFLFCIYPLIWIFYRIPKFFLKRWPHILFFSPLIYAFLKDFRSTLILVFGSLVSTVFILKDVSDQSTMFSMGFLAIALLIYLARSLKLAFSTTHFNDLSKFVKPYADKFTQGDIGVFLDKEEADDNKSKRNERKTGKNREESLMFRIYITHQMSQLISEKMRFLAKSPILDLYLILSVITKIIISIVSFQILYIGLYNLDAGHFILKQDFSYTLFLLLSFESFASLDNVLIQPVTVMATALCRAELIVAFSILAIILTTMNAYYKNKYKTDAETLADDLSRIIMALEGVCIDTYKRKVDQLEAILAKDKINKSVINYLRANRGLEKLDDDAIEGELDDQPGQDSN